MAWTRYGTYSIGALRLLLGGEPNHVPEVGCQEHNVTGSILPTFLGWGRGQLISTLSVTFLRRPMELRRHGGFHVDVDYGRLSEAFS